MSDRLNQEQLTVLVSVVATVIVGLLAIAGIKIVASFIFDNIIVIFLIATFAAGVGAYFLWKTE